MSDNLVSKSVFLTKSLTKILFLTSLIFVSRTSAVTKSLITRILFSTSPIFALRAEVVPKSLALGIFSQHL